MGAEPLAHLAAEVEADLRAGQGLPKADLVARMDAELHAARAAVEQWLSARAVA
jgi:hypothetical protein